jgi:hypothetical protein
VSRRAQNVLDGVGDIARLKKLLWTCLSGCGEQPATGGDHAGGDEAHLDVAVPKVEEDGTRQSG